MRFLLAASLFVLAVVASTLVAKVFYVDALEAEFEETALESLRAAGFEEVTVDFDHHDARIGGYVDSEEEKEVVLDTLREALPVAHLPSLESVALQIRPSIPPELHVRKEEGARTVVIEGVLGKLEEGTRSLLGARIHALEAIANVDNRIELDPRRLALRHPAELVSLATEVLRHSGEHAAEIRYRDGILEIAGRVENDGLESTLLELARQVRADSIREEIEVPAPVDPGRPSTLVLTRNRFGLTLTGSLGSAEAGRRLVETLARIDPPPRLNDRLEVDAERSPGAWEDSADVMLPRLLELFVGEMTVEFGEEQVRLHGTVESEAVRRELLGVLAPLREGTAAAPEILADIRIAGEDGAGEGPPARLLAEYESGLLSLTGNLPDASFAANLEEALEDAMPDLLVKNSLEETPSSPGRDWSRKLGSFFEEVLPRLETLVLRIEDATVRLEGITLELPDRQLVQNVAVNTFPSHFELVNELSHETTPFPRPELLPEERTRLSEDLKRFPVYFATNSEIVDEKGREAIEAIVGRLRETDAEVDLVVTGFADNVGNAAYNRELSLRRADSVRQALVAAGIPEERLARESRGEDVTNVARSERWKARRVEVSLAPPGDGDENEEGGEEP